MLKVSILVWISLSAASGGTATAPPLQPCFTAPACFGTSFPTGTRAASSQTPGALRLAPTTPANHNPSASSFSRFIPGVNAPVAPVGTPMELRMQNPRFDGFSPWEGENDDVVNDNLESWNEIMYSELRRRSAVVAELKENSMPDPDLSPRGVIKTVMQALMRNDYPVPDHGCATAIRFCSEKNPIGCLEPRELGDFYRRTEYSALVTDGERFEYLGNTHFVENDNGQFAVQDVLVEGIYDCQTRLRFQLWLNRDTRCWLTDSITIIRPGPI